MIIVIILNVNNFDSSKLKESQKVQNYCKYLSRKYLQLGVTFIKIELPFLQLYVKNECSEALQ